MPLCLGMKKQTGRAIKHAPKYVREFVRGIVWYGHVVGW
jgi:hypothetical protein